MDIVWFKIFTQTGLWFVTDYGTCCWFTARKWRPAFVCCCIAARDRLLLYVFEHSYVAGLFWKYAFDNFVMIYRPSLKTKLKDQKSQQVLTRAHFLKKPFEISAYVSSLGEIMMGSLRFSTLFQFPLCILFLFKQMPPVPHRRCYAVQHTAPCPYAVLLCTFPWSS